MARRREARQGKVRGERRRVGEGRAGEERGGQRRGKDGGGRVKCREVAVVASGVYRWVILLNFLL